MFEETIANVKTFFAWRSVQEQKEIATSGYSADRRDAIRSIADDFTNPAYRFNETQQQEMLFFIAQRPMVDRDSHVRSASTAALEICVQHLDTPENAVVLDHMIDTAVTHIETQRNEQSLGYSRFLNTAQTAKNLRPVRRKQITLILLSEHKYLATEPNNWHVRRDALQSLGKMITQPVIQLDTEQQKDTLLFIAEHAGNDFESNVRKAGFETLNSCIAHLDTPENMFMFDAMIDTGLNNPESNSFLISCLNAKHVAPPRKQQIATRLCQSYLEDSNIQESVNTFILNADNPEQTAKELIPQIFSVPVDAVAVAGDSRLNDIEDSFTTLFEEHTTLRDFTVDTLDRVITAFDITTPASDEKDENLKIYTYLTQAVGRAYDADYTGKSLVISADIGSRDDNPVVVRSTDGIAHSFAATGCQLDTLEGMAKQVINTYGDGDRYGYSYGDADYEDGLRYFSQYRNFLTGACSTEEDAETLDAMFADTDSARELAKPARPA